MPFFFFLISSCNIVPDFNMLLFPFDGAFSLHTQTLDEIFSTDGNKTGMRRVGFPYIASNTNSIPGRILPLEVLCSVLLRYIIHTCLKENQTLVHKDTARMQSDDPLRDKPAHAKAAAREPRTRWELDAVGSSYES
jgi:hypothetical protein